MFGLGGLSVFGMPVERFVGQLPLCQSEALSLWTPKFDPPHDFEVVGQAGMGDRRVVRRKIGRVGVAVDERSVAVAENLPVTVVLHHDHENVVEVGNAFWNVALLGEPGFRGVRRAGPELRLFSSWWSPEVVD
jgi:hypothetical protein